MIADRIITRIGSLRGLSPLRFKSFGSSSSAPAGSSIPETHMEYTISATDTIERVAAKHDCTVGELMKLNKMGSRMVFPGQKILVPVQNDEVFEANTSKGSSVDDGIRKGPGRAVPAQIRRGSFSKSAPVSKMDDEDTDCLQRFLKIKVKQITESDGTVSGTLLVTPNCLMFDPDVMHPLVKENGPDLYGMVANMEEITDVSVYKEIAALTGNKEEKKKDIFDPEHLRTPNESPKKQQQQKSEVVFEAGDSTDEIGSETTLPSITEEVVEERGERHRSVTIGEDSIRKRTTSEHWDERPRSYSELDTLEDKGRFSGAKFSPNAARRSFGKLGRTLSARAKSIQGAVTHGVVTHTKSAADSIQMGIDGVKEQAKAAADRVVDRGQSLMNESLNGVTEMFSIPDEETQIHKSPMTLKREQSLAKLENLKRQTAEARENSQKENKASEFVCGTTADEMPDLFTLTDEMSEKKRITSTDDGAPPESPILPYYMAVRLTRNKKRKNRRSSPSEEDCAFGNKLKREFWFAVPRNRADNIYHFLLQWSPEKYGLDSEDHNESMDELMKKKKKAEEKGFIVLDSNADESLTGDKSTTTTTPFGSSLLNREWELVTVSEMCRRLSLDHELEMPIPEGAETSQILDEIMIRQVMDILPPRAEGYPWVQIYSSEKHGFSLSTMYRKMAEFDEDLSPVLVIIRDTKEHVFGAVVSSAIRPSDHYTGTGDSCLLWRFTGEAPHTRELRNFNWTGDNQFFVNAAKDALSIGAGAGRYGLWLDADLNHGRSQRCETFNNEPLCGENEDFVIQFMEAYGFRI